jgi:ADP-heptose:LPS heptosyltransferase
MGLLFIGSTRIGDAVLSSGALAWMLARWPAAPVTVACGPAAAGFYASVPRLDRLIRLEKRPAGGHWRALWRQVAGRLWTAVADTRRSAVPFLLLARRRYMMGRDRAGVHKVLQASAMMGASEALAPTLWIGDAERRRADELVGGRAPFLAVAPTANWGGKQWPAERFAALVERLTAPGGILPGAAVAVFGAASERAMAAPLLAALPPARALDLVGATDILAAAACLGRASFFVGNDSALMHLAAAAGTPTLGLFGPSREAWYAPWGPRAAAVRTDLSFDEILARPGYDHRRHETHMDTLPVDKALAAAEALWARAGGDRA